MAQPIYSTSVRIPFFRGMDQTGDGHNKNLQYAYEMENVNVEGGSFKPMREGLLVPQELAKPIDTLAYLHRRFGQNKGTMLVAISNKRVFTKALDGSDEWVQRYPAIVSNEETSSPFSSSYFDWLTYEISVYHDYDASRTYSLNERVRKRGLVYKAKNAISTPEAWNAAHWDVVADADPDDYHVYDPDKTYAKDDRVVYPETKNYKCTTAITTPEAWNVAHWTELTGSDPVDILLLTNTTDGMYCLFGDDLTVAPVRITPDPTNNPGENLKFGIITRYNERIWGAGLPDNPDSLYYSVPYDPFDWKQNTLTPEEGGGVIKQPSWDGDVFVALRQHGNALLTVKRNSIWRINGTDPGTFVMTQQYGGGTIEENTLISYNDHVYMLGEHGLMRYDGIGAYPFLQDEVQNLMYEQANHAQFSKCSAGMRNGVYCLSLPINGSEYCNAIMEYDIQENTIALRTGITVSSFMQIDERLFYTSATEPGRVFELQDRIGMPLPCKWVSGYQDLDQKSSIKSAFIVYMFVESEAPVELRVGIRTEKKIKRKVISTKPGKMTRLHLNLQGRIFRLEIESYSAVPFTIAGGVKVDLELDPD